MLLANWLGLVELFVLGHFLAGALCTLRVSLFIYLAECAPDCSRGWAVVAVGSGGNLLLLLVSPLCLPAVFGNDRHWWLLPAICLLLAMIHLFVAGHFPESPKHLFIGNGRKTDAEHSVRFYHGSSANIGEQIMCKLITCNRWIQLPSSRNTNRRNRWCTRRVSDCDCFGRIAASGKQNTKGINFHSPLSSFVRWSLGLSLLVGFVPALSLVSLKSQYLESMLMRYGLDQSAAMVATMVSGLADSQ